MSDLKKVLKELLPVSAKWYDFGLELDLTSDTLDNIKSTFQENNERLRECIKIFLKQASRAPTWEIIVKALAEPNVGHAELARKLKDEFVEENSDTCESKLTACGEGIKVVFKFILAIGLAVCNTCTLSVAT